MSVKVYFRFKPTLPEWSNGLISRVSMHVFESHTLD